MLMKMPIFNPRRMHRRVTVVVLFVCLSVCLSVNSLTATYLVFKSKMQCHKVPYGDPNAYIMWILPTLLSLPVLALFADSKLLDLT